MRNRMRIGTMLIAATTLLGADAIAPRAADAHGYRHPRFGRIVFGGPYFGYGWGFGPYWGPYYGRYFYGPAGGVDLGAAMIAGYGAVDLNVKPNRAEVKVDGKFVGEARDLDGYPSYLWLKEGAHQVRISKNGFAPFDETVEVRAGMKIDLKIRLQKEEVKPPTGKAGETK